MMTLAHEAEADKELLRHLLAGEVYGGEDSDGTAIYVPASAGECEQMALQLIDAWYFRAKQLADSGRAMERIASRHGWTFTLGEYADEMAAAEAEYADYLYEFDKEELYEEIREIEDADD